MCPVCARACARVCVLRATQHLFGAAAAAGGAAAGGAASLALLQALVGFGALLYVFGKGAKFRCGCVVDCTTCGCCCTACWLPSAGACGCMHAMPPLPHLGACMC
jgi:hypothetical protein